MGDDRERKPPGLLESLLGNLGLNKGAPARIDARRTLPSDRMTRSGRETNISPASAKVTEPLSADEKAKQSEERRYLIAAYEATPTLIPEFQNPQYMYKLISNEREYVQECLRSSLSSLKKLYSQGGSEPPADIQSQIDQVDATIQEYRNDLTRLFIIIKKVAGVQKSGTGGTDFLDPLEEES